MKNVSLLVLCAALLAGCGDGSSDLSDKDKATTQNNFSRPLTDAEKGQMDGTKGSPAGGVDPASKKPATGG